MHMISPFMPIPSSTKLTEFLYISNRKKLPHPFSAPPSAGAGAYAKTTFYLAILMFVRHLHICCLLLPS